MEQLRDSTADRVTLMNLARRRRVRAGELFASGLNTMQIAKVMKITEAEAYNRQSEYMELKHLSRQLA